MAYSRLTVVRQVNNTIINNNKARINSVVHVFTTGNLLLLLRIYGCVYVFMCVCMSNDNPLAINGQA